MTLNLPVCHRQLTLFKYMLILQLTNFLILQNMYSKPYMTCSHKKHCLSKSPQGEEKLWEQFAGPKSSPIPFQFGIGQARPCRRLERACQKNPGSETGCLASYRSQGLYFNTQYLYFQYFCSHQQHNLFQVKWIKLRSRTQIPQAAQLYSAF